MKLYNYVSYDQFSLDLFVLTAGFGSGIYINVINLQLYLLRTLQYNFIIF